MQQRTLLRRVLRTVLETAFEKVLRRVLRRCLAVDLMGRRVLRRVLRRGSKKGLSRRRLEGRSTPFRKYDPLGVRPTQVDISQIRTVLWRMDIGMPRTAMTVCKYRSACGSSRMMATKQATEPH